MSNSLTIASDVRIKTHGLTEYCSLTAKDPGIEIVRYWGFLH